jgi:hypothetical protein
MENVWTGEPERTAANSGAGAARETSSANAEKYQIGLIVTPIGGSNYSSSPGLAVSSLSGTALMVMKPDFTRAGQLASACGFPPGKPGTANLFTCICHQVNQMRISPCFGNQ